MKAPPGCRRLSPLGVALGLCVTLGFTLGLLGGPFRRRSTPSVPCRPRSHVLFLKTHKTGGSSLVNVLSRFGESRGLRFALPHRYQFGYPAPFRAERVRGFSPRGGKFDLLCHHMRFYLPEVQRVMPNDTFFFSIVRDPGTLGESAFSYFRGAAPAFRLSPSLDAFLASPWRFFRPGIRGNHYAKNLQWFDFGLPDPVDPKKIPEILQNLEKTFPLVLLAENFDESLVLLRDRLCWPRDAVDLFPHNSRGESRKKISQEQMRKLRAWNSLDWALYSHFNRSFWRQAREFGIQKLRREVEEIRKRREFLAGKCLRGGGPVPAQAIPDGNLRPFQPPGGEKILGFALREGLSPQDRELCGRMALPELPYKDLLERKQFGAKNESLA